MRKALEKIKVTPELLDHYKKVGKFLKENPMIQSKKLVLGYQVAVNTIPDHLIEEWLEVTKYEHNE